MAAADNEVGARLVLSGRQEFTAEAKASSDAVMNIAKSASEAGSEAAKSANKFSTISQKAKEAGIQTERSMGAAGRAAGAQLGEGVRRGARASQAGIREAGAEAGEGFGSRMRETAGEYFRTFAGPLIAIFGAEKLKESMTEAFHEAKTLMIQQRQTNAVLKSTGGVANVSGKEVGEMAEHLALVGHTTKSAGQQAVNMLLSFSRVRNEAGKNNDVFTQTAKLGADVAARFGTSLPASMRLLGRAISNPSKAAGALSRIIGGPLTKSQIDYIKSLQAGGKSLQAQKYILGLVNKAVGGAADASVTSGDRLRVKWEEVTTGIATKALPIFYKLGAWLAGPGIEKLEKFATGISKKLQPYMTEFIGWMKSTGIPILTILGNDVLKITKWFIGFAASIAKALLPYVKDLAKWMGTHLLPAIKGVGEWVQKNSAWIKPLVVGVLAIAAAIKLWGIATALWTTITEAATAVQTAFNVVLNANPVGIIILAVIGLAAAFVYAYKHSQTFRNIVKAVFHDVMAVIKTVVNFFKSHWRTMLAFATGGISVAVGFIIRHWHSITGAVSSVINWVRKHWKLLLSIITGPIGAAVIWVISHFGQIKTFVGGLITDIKRWFSGLPGFFKTALKDVASFITAPFKAAFNFVAKLWNDTLGKVHFKIPSWVPGVGGDGFSFPQMPTFKAQGGAVNRNSPYIVGERGPELFFPSASGAVMNNQKSVATIATAIGTTQFNTPQGSAMVPRSGGSGEPIHIHIHLKGKQIAEAVWDETNKKASYV